MIYKEIQNGFIRGKWKDYKPNYSLQVFKTTTIHLDLQVLVYFKFCKWILVEKWLT